MFYLFVIVDAVSFDDVCFKWHKMLRHYSCVVSEICEGKMVTRQIIRFIGDTVVLQCRTTSNGSKQWHRGVAGDKFLASTSRGVSPLYPQLSLNDSTKGQFDLLINSTQQGDADMYSCTAGFNRVVPTELTLLGKCFVLMCYESWIFALFTNWCQPSTSHTE